MMDVDWVFGCALLATIDTLKKCELMWGFGPRRAALVARELDAAVRRADGLREAHVLAWWALGADVKAI